MATLISADLAAAWPGTIIWFRAPYSCGLYTSASPTETSQSLGHSCCGVLIIKMHFIIFFLVLPVYCYQPISLQPHAHMLSHVTPWIAACQTFPGKNTGVGGHFFLHIIFFFLMHLCDNFYKSFFYNISLNSSLNTGG